MSKLSQEQVSALRATFDHIDQDGDGKVSVADLKSTLLNLRETPDDAEITKMLKEATGSGSKTLDFSGYLALMSSKFEQLPDAGDLKDAFGAFSKDGDVDTAELKRAVEEARHRNGAKLEQKDIDRILDEFSKKNGITGKNKFMVEQYLSSLN